MRVTGKWRNAAEYCNPFRIRRGGRVAVSDAGRKTGVADAVEPYLNGFYATGQQWCELSPVKLFKLVCL